MKKKQKQAAAAAIAVPVILIVIYVAFAIYFQSHFCFGTTLDGLSVGGCGVEKAERMIGQEIENYSLRLVAREGEPEEITGSSISLTPVFEGEIEKLLEGQNSFAWIAVWIRKENLETDHVVAYDEEAMEQTVKQLSCLKKENQREPVDAGISEYAQGEGYHIVPADYGTELKEEALLKAIEEAVTVLADELVLEEAGCYRAPDVTEENPELIANVDALNKYVQTTIDYELGEKSETLDANTIHTWLSVEDGKVNVDREAVEAYVKELAKKYNTAYHTKHFKTSYGKEITISNGFYGWKIDQPAETEQILADLETGENVSREPVYSQRANSHGENDYGDSYVEINLTAQHLFFYKNGGLVLESDFVSGNVSKGNATPVGAFGLTYKTTDAVLRGADYETPVNYWMPFNGDVGMHDATWRNKFGGNIYKTNGSHGCINLPLSVAKSIYAGVDTGYAVFVYELPGTESKVQQQEDAANVVNLINSIGIVTLESETAIVGARNLYNALSDGTKAYVTNYETLVAAEAALAALKSGGAVPEQPVQEQQPVPEEQPVQEQQQPVEQAPQPEEQPVQEQQQPAPEEQPVQEQQQPVEQAPVPEEQPVQEQQPVPEGQPQP